MSSPWLVLAHEATNSGAPRMLLEVLRGVRAAMGPGWSCEFLLDRGGALVAEMEALGPVHRLSHPIAEGQSLAAKAVRGLVDRAWLKPRRLRTRVRDWRARGGELILSNTATNGRLLAALPADTGLIVTLVHELEYSLRRFNRPQDLAATLKRTDLFLAVSSAVLNDLYSLGVSEKQCMLLPNILQALPPLPDRTGAIQSIIRRHDLPANTRLVTGCGHIDPVKGTDLFVEMANSIVSADKTPLAFVWIGGTADRVFAANVRSAAPRSVIFVGEVEDPSQYFAASEVVVVTSRVESFSRVALEAGSLGRPVLAFAAARGPVDLLPTECLVGDGGASAMAASVTSLLASPEPADRLGAALRCRIEQGFLASPWIHRLLERMAAMSHG